MAAAEAEEGGVERGGGGTELRGDVRWRGRGRAAQRVTPRPPRSQGLMGKVLAGAGGSCGACGTAAVPREAAGTGLFGSGEAGRQASGGSGGPGLGRPTEPGRKAPRGVGRGYQQESAD